MKQSIFFLCLLFSVSGNSQSDKNNTNSSFNWEKHATQLVKNPLSSIPKYVKFHAQKAPTVTEIIEQLQKISALELISSTTDEFGVTHDRYTQLVNGNKIEHTMLILHHLNGKVQALSGDFCSNIPKNKTASISFNQALAFAQKYIGAETYKWEDPKEELFLKREQENENATYFPSKELVYISKNGTLKNMQLAYKLNIYAKKPLSRNNVYVDANTGEILFNEELIHTTEVDGIAQTAYSGTRTIKVDSLSSNSYRLRETGRGNGIQTFNLSNGFDQANATDFFDNDNVWNNINPQLDQYATDAHWGAEMTYDYFFQVHNRNSIDGNGFALKSYIHYGTDFINAFWDGQRMTYGDGDLSQGYTPLTTMAIAGHEITHGLVSNTADLIYQNESGALNESFADIFGISIDFWSRPGFANWKMGDEISADTNDYFRSMSDPNIKGDPDTYEGNFWVSDPAIDNGGVHSNSGVQNYWFYLLVNGGTGTNDNGDSYNVTGIGMLNASKIAFRNLTVYLSPNSTFEDARFYGIQAAIDLFGACSPEVESTTNAWYAVGVGQEYSPFTIANFKAKDTIGCNLPSSIEFINTTLNGGSYIWYFGDGDSSVLLNPTHNYTAYGTYTVTLYADGGVCGKDTLIKTNYITIDSTLDCPVILAANTTSPIQTKCNGQLLDNGGLEDVYTPNQDSYITIAPTGASSVILYFNSFDVEDNTNCTFDFLEVYDGNSTAAPLIGRYCNFNNPPPASLNSSGGAITLYFHSDPGLELEGFDISWECYNDTLPLAIMDAENHVICPEENVNFISTSINTTSHSWTFPGGTPSSSIATNPTVNYPLAGTYTAQLIASNSYGNDTTTLDILVDSTCTVTLKTNGTAPTKVACVGTLMDDGGINANYSASQDSYITIAPNSNSPLGLTFTQFDIEPGSGDISPCDFDYIRIFDGTSIGGTLLGRYCNGYPPPATIFAASGKATVHFHADPGLELAGFILNWDCEASSLNENDYDLTKVTIYPNPTTNMLTVDVLFNQQKDLNLTLVDLLGNVLMTQSVKANELSYKQTLDLSKYATGTYVLLINGNGYKVDKK